MRRLRHQIGAWFYTRFPSLGRRWAQDFVVQTHNGVPWTPLPKPLAQIKFALVTTGGTHLHADQPFDMLDPRGDPTFRAIPANTPLDAITITHDYYNHADADADVNIVLPITRFQELVTQGVIAGLGTSYGFMGHITDQHIETLITKSAPAVARRMRDEGITAALLTPA